MQIKYRLLVSALCVSSSFAGSTQEVIPTNYAAPTLGSWFVGGTYGRSDNADSLLADRYSQIVVSPTGFIKFSDMDLESYTLHVGKDLGMKVLGCDLAAYLEVGYTNADFNLRGRESDIDPISEIGFDFEVIPVTLNLKLERVLIGKLSGYLTAGAGVAFTSLDISRSDGVTKGSQKETDVEFFMQASAGLLYNVTDQWEVYGGVRWSNLQDMEFGTSQDNIIDEPFSYELGVRYNF